MITDDMRTDRSRQILKRQNYEEQPDGTWLSKFGTAVILNIPTLEDEQTLARNPEFAAWQISYRTKNSK